MFWVPVHGFLPSALAVCGAWQKKSRGAWGQVAVRAGEAAGGSPGLRQERRREGPMSTWGRWVRWKVGKSRRAGKRGGGGGQETHSPCLTELVTGGPRECSRDAVS